MGHFQRGVTGQLLHLRWSRFPAIYQEIDVRHPGSMEIELALGRPFWDIGCKQILFQ